MYLRTLILNQQYRPHEILDWKDATTSMFNGKIEIIAQYDEVLAVIGKNHLASFPDLKKALRQVIGTDAESITIKVPAVAVLRRAVPIFKDGMKYNRINLAIRDNFECQYCGDQLPMHKLNRDHVFPQSRGGKTTWENTVMSCYPCNTRKKDMTPQEAGMALLSVPTAPKTLHMSGPYINKDKAPEEWIPYIAA